MAGMMRGAKFELSLPHQTCAQPLGKSIQTSRMGGLEFRIGPNLCSTGNRTRPLRYTGILAHSLPQYRS